MIYVLHRIVAPGSDDGFAPNRDLEVGADVLTAVIEATRRAGFAIVSLDEAVARLEAGGDGAPFACLTFDDGYRDNATVARAVCERHDAPFCVYVTTGFVDRRADVWWIAIETLIRRERTIAFEIDGVRWSLPAESAADKGRAFAALARVLRPAGAMRRTVLLDALERVYGPDFRRATASLMMTWEDVAALADHPLATIGVHTETHPMLRTLADDDAEREIAGSARALEARLGCAVQHLAYPFGDPASADAREFALARRLGFATAVTTRFGTIRSGRAHDRFALPRIPVNPFDDADTIAVKLGGLAERLRALRPG